MIAPIVLPGTNQSMGVFQAGFIGRENGFVPDEAAVAKPLATYRGQSFMPSSLDQNALRWRSQQDEHPDGNQSVALAHLAKGANRAEYGFPGIGSPDQPVALKPSDQAVLARIGRSPSGASAVDIARASLGPKARRHSITSLNLIGLAVAARLVGLRVITPTRANNFKLTAPPAAQAFA